MTKPGPGLDRAARLGLVAMALAVLVIANDFTALSVAIPSIESTFRADLTTSQWVINGYALVFGVFIVTGGRVSPTCSAGGASSSSAARSSPSSRSSAARRHPSRSCSARGP